MNIELMQGSKICKDINKAMQETIRRYESNEIRVEELTNLKIDLEHKIENSQYDVIRGYNVYAELRECLKERRRLKNENMSLKPVYQLFVDNKQFKNSIAKVQGDCRKLEECASTATYKARFSEKVANEVNQYMEKNNTDYKQNNQDEKQPAYTAYYSNDSDKKSRMKELRMKYHKVNLIKKENKIECFNPKF